MEQRDTACRKCAHPRSRHGGLKECSMRKKDQNGLFRICNCTEWEKPKRKDGQPRKKPDPLLEVA